MFSLLCQDQPPGWSLSCNGENIVFQIKGVKEQLAVELIWRFVSPTLASIMYLLINVGKLSAYLNTTSFFYSLIVGKKSSFRIHL